MMAATGHNAFHGFDTGPAPPGFFPTQPAGMSQNPNFFGSGMNFGWPAPLPMAQPVMQQPVMQQPMMIPPYGGFGMGGMTYPAAAPFTDHGFPGIHLRNHTGGVGLEPGYDYFFPKENCKIHVFKTVEKPWQCTVHGHDNSTHVKLYVPVNTNVKDLMQNLGCTNDDPKKNILYELAEKGSGQWSTGLRIVGDNKDMMKKTIGDLGWNSKRTGYEQAVVWLWLTSEGE
jgi:hypothetical protein